MTQAKTIGELAVVALKAKDLPNREIVGKQDPFCVFRLGEEAKKTKTDYRGGQHPVWDDQVNLIVPEGKVKMRVQLFDEDAKREDLISEADIDISTVIKEGEQDGWFPLTYKGRKAGEIYLELTFYSARPPPRRQPTRYRAGMRPQSYQGVPPVPSPSNYSGTTGRPLPPAPSASTSTPARYNNVFPAPYTPAQPVQSVQHSATPHMPPSLTPTPSTSTSTGYPSVQRPPQQYLQQHHQQQQQQPGNNNNSYYPPPNSGATQPLLSQPFRPGHSPQNSQGGQVNQGYPPTTSHHHPTPQGQSHHQPYPPQGPPAQYGNFTTPVMASYPPPGSSNGVNFPEPQRNSTFSFSGQQQPPYPNPSAPLGHSYPPNHSGYPPNPSAGYPPNTSSGYPPSGYPPNPSSGYPPNPPSSYSHH
ncbi:uncharacterized protein BX664DRAFT_281493 [Halteromyces radiatus]|uniref:uncharacterized protein n=1 Tax=Halteromyces radiatus TaxID=101107 RepID=UPI00221E6453|nr:uncharacterized protein BX664DRAFT_281493 [Halteromyces radiatus]KAI8090061.1 hypothetical protein BX664DRAFT_281493 [Halteromyces radiatus]